MKLFMMAILASAMLWAQAPAGEIVGVGNFSHIVQNLDKSLEFYRDVLGLEVAVNQPFSPNLAIAKLGNTLGGQSRYAALQVPGSAIGVELIEYKDIERKPQHPHFYDPGAANMILRVRDLDSVFAKLQKFGATVVDAAPASFEATKISAADQTGSIGKPHSSRAAKTLGISRILEAPFVQRRIGNRPGPMKCGGYTTQS